LLLACSGGLDSVTCLDLLLRLRPSLGHRLAVAHIDHGLRDDSARDGGFVSDLAADAELKCDVVRVELDRGAATQERARAARYDALRRVAGDRGCAAIVTAHHADDQAETVLMRAARGAGAVAMAGVRRRRGIVVRPLLDVSRADLVAHATRRGLAWREDPSNAVLDYERNRVRHEVMPVLETIRPGAARGLARTAVNLADEGASARYWAAVAIEQHGRLERSAGTDGEVTVLRFPRTLLADAPGPVGAWLFEAAVRVGAPAPGRRAVEQVHATLRAGSQTSARCQLRGMTVEVVEHEVLVRGGDIAHPPSAD